MHHITQQSGKLIQIISSSRIEDAIRYLKKGLSNRSNATNKKKALPKIEPPRLPGSGFIAKALALLILCYVIFWIYTYPEERDWLLTRFYHTSSLYEGFAEKHELSKHREEAIWRKGVLEDRPLGYQEYLDQYPKGGKRKNALEALDRLELRQFVQIRQNKEEDIRMYLDWFPQGKHLQQVVNLAIQHQLKVENNTNGYDELTLREKEDLFWRFVQIQPTAGALGIYCQEFVSIGSPEEAIRTCEELAQKQKQERGQQGYDLWKKVRAADKPTAYLRYVERFPEGWYTEIALKELHQAGIPFPVEFLDFEKKQITVAQEYIAKPVADQIPSRPAEPLTEEQEKSKPRSSSTTRTPRQKPAQKEPTQPKVNQHSTQDQAVVNSALKEQAIHKTDLDALQTREQLPDPIVEKDAPSEDRSKPVDQVEGKQREENVSTPDSMKQYNNNRSAYPAEKKAEPIKEKQAVTDSMLWAATQAKRTTKAYRAYLEQFPNGQFAGQAKAADESLTWNNAQETKSWKAYKDYVDHHPEGQYAGKASRKADRLFWRTVRKADTFEAYQAYLEHFPEGRHKRKASARAEK